MQRFYLFILIVLTAIMAKAHDVYINGVFYYLNKEDKTASVTYRGSYISEYLDEYLGEVTIPLTITYDDIEYTVNSIDDGAFENCIALTAVKGTEIKAAGKLYYTWNVSKIGRQAFKGCKALEEITLASPLESIGESAFYGCKSMKSIVLPSTLNCIGRFAFSGCEGVTSVSINSSQLSIDLSAFSGCNNIESVYIGDPSDWYNISFSNITSNPLYYGHHLYYYRRVVYPEGGPQPSQPQYKKVEVTSLDVPENVTSIGKFSFAGWHAITSLTIPSSIISIEESAFENCDSLKEIVISDSLKTIKEQAFYHCDSLTNIKVGYSVESINRDAFGSCANIKNVYIEDLKSWCMINFTSNPLNYAQHFFVNGEEIKELVIPEDITFIGSIAFYGFKGFTSVYLPNTVDRIEPSAFGGADYNIYCYPKPYCIIYNQLGSRAKLYGAPVYRITNFWTTETTIKVLMKALDFIPAPEGKELTATPYIRGLNGNEVYPDEKGFCIIKGISPGIEKYVYPITKYSDGSVVYYEPKLIKTNDLTINLSSVSTPTTINWRCNVKAGDATIKSLTITSNGISTNNSDSLLLTGLRPETQYTCNVEVKCKEGGVFTKKTVAVTKNLTLETLKPKSVSSTCAIVAAKTNIEDVETGVGFQWKKYDAPASLAPSEGYAAIYNGQMEGYIKNLQPTYYNVRAFYKTANGSLYFGEWVTFDQTDFSYFEPTIHTFETVEVSSNSAKVKAYVLAGTDEIIEQGFEYWLSSTANSKAIRMEVVPRANEDVNTVLGTGQVMVVTLTDLQPNSEYTFRSFVKTASGTTYGEERSLITESDPTGIGNVEYDVPTKSITGYYDLEGRKHNEPQKGLNIIRYSDGSVRKVLVE